MPGVASKMPVIFVGHGNPMNAMSQNSYTLGWRRIGESVPRPVAVLVISAHWYIPSTAVTAMDRPRTIHDFGGFPGALYEMRYPAPGDPKLALRAQELLKPIDVKLDHDWGLDHGAWSVLTHVFPRADVPIVQLSIDRTKPAVFHYEAAKRLAPLRDEQVLIIGSGNLVHNLHTYAWAGGRLNLSNGPRGLSNRCENCCSPAITVRSLTTRRWGAMRHYRSLRRITTCRCSMRLLYAEKMKT